MRERIGKKREGLLREGKKIYLVREGMVTVRMATLRLVIAKRYVNSKDISKQTVKEDVVTDGRDDGK